MPTKHPPATPAPSPSNVTPATRSRTARCCSLLTRAKDDLERLPLHAQAAGVRDNNVEQDHAPPLVPGLTGRSVVISRGSICDSCPTSDDQVSPQHAA